MRYELPHPDAVRLWRQPAPYDARYGDTRPPCVVCGTPCRTLLQVCELRQEPEPWGWKAVCSTCHQEKGDAWIKAHLWRLAISLPTLAIDRALGIDPKGRIVERTAAQRATDIATFLETYGSPADAIGNTPVNHQPRRLP